MANSDFDTPAGGAIPGENGYTQSGEFEAPAGPDALAAEAEAFEVQTFLASVDPQILAAKAKIEKLVCPFGAVGSIQSQEVIDANIVGVAIGVAHPSDGVGAGAPGEPILEVYAIEPESTQRLSERLASAVGIAALAASDFPINVVVTGIIDAQPHRMRLRPAPGGISVGHKAITAEPLGRSCAGDKRRARRG